MALFRELVAERQQWKQSLKIFIVTNGRGGSIVKANLNVLG